MASRTSKDDNYSLINKKLDPSSPFWLKKYQLLLKKTENVEKQNLRLLNRIYHMRVYYRRTCKEKQFLMKRLDQHNDNYKSVKFFSGPALSDALLEPPNSDCPRVKKAFNRALVLKANQIKAKLKKTSTEMSSKSPTNLKKNQLPKKPLNAFLWYCNDQRDIFVANHPEMNHQELTKALSKSWNLLEENEKEAYYEMFDRDRSRYENEMRVYRIKFPASGQESAAKPTKGKSKKCSATKSVSKKKKKAVKSKKSRKRKSATSKKGADRSETTDNTKNSTNQTKQSKDTTQTKENVLKKKQKPSDNDRDSDKEDDTLMIDVDD